MKDFQQLRIGILGGGQLGKMLCQAGSRWGLQLFILDDDAGFPAGQVTPHFTEGSFRDPDAVYAFGKDKDVLTIEIEDVAVEALERLQQEGVAVYPDPAVLRIIRDKGDQKTFYRDRALPTAPFHLYPDKDALLDDIRKGELHYPFVQKTRRAGYDGRGVAVIQGPEDLDRLLDGPCLTEDKIPMLREVAVIVTRDVHGQANAFPPVEMAFHTEANLVEMLLCPAHLTASEAAEAERLALEVADAFGTVGLLAVEMFQLADGSFLVNEVAPRPHNSGHHTIECCNHSQYEQHLRAIAGLPLGETSLQRPGVMINLLGAPGYSGPVHYQGWDTCMQMPGVFLHLYGKSETRPFRKMGHATITGDTLEEAIQTARIVQETLQVIAL